MTYFGIKWAEKDWYTIKQKTNQPTNQPNQSINYLKLNPNRQ